MKTIILSSYIFFTKSFENDENISIFRLFFFFKASYIIKLCFFYFSVLRKSFLFLATKYINDQAANLNKNSYHLWVAVRFRILDP